MARNCLKSETDALCEWHGINLPIELLRDYATLQMEELEQRLDFAAVPSGTYLYALEVTDQAGRFHRLTRHLSLVK